MRRGRPLERLGLLAGGTLVGLVAIELALRLVLPRGGPHLLHEAVPGRPAFRPGSVSRYRTPEFEFVLSINAHGRRDVEWTPAMVADPDNILFIGDSFVLGYGVSTEAAMPGRLQRLLETPAARPHVFNFGFPGSFPQYEALLAEASGLGIAARRVVVGIFVGNDFDAEPGGPPPEASFPQRLLAESRLATFVRERALASTRFVGLALRAGRVLHLPVYDSPSSYIYLRHPSPEQEARFDRILRGALPIAERCRREGRLLLFVVFPNRIQVENRAELAGDLYDADRPNRRILEFCAARGLECFDLLPSLRSVYESTGAPLYFLVDRHLNEHGNEAAAAVIAQRLKETAGAHSSR